MAKKLDQLRGALGQNVAESAGAGVARQVSPAAPAQFERFRDTARLAEALAVPVSRVVPDPEQPRRKFDDEALDNLARSIQEHGLLQPIRVRYDEEAGLYVVVAGERRWRAARMIGLARIPAVVAEMADLGRLRLEQLVENLQREDLSAVDQAAAFRRLMRERGWNQKQLAAELALDPGQVSRTLALETLPEEARAAVRAGVLGASTAAEIAAVPEPAAREELAREAVAGKLTRQEVRRRRGVAQRREFAVDLGDGVTVVARGVGDAAGAVHALERALEELRRRAA